MQENPDLKPLTPDEVDKKISDVNAKLKINDNLQSRQQSLNIAATTIKSENMTAKDGYIIVSWLFMIASVAFSIYGVYTLYNNDLSTRIVGGDAYNFII